MLRGMLPDMLLHIAVRLLCRDNLIDFPIPNMFGRVPGTLPRSDGTRGPCPGPSPDPPQDPPPGLLPGTPGNLPGRVHAPGRSRAVPRAPCPSRPSWGRSRTVPGAVPGGHARGPERSRARSLASKYRKVHARARAHVKVIQNKFVLQTFQHKTSNTPWAFNDTSCSRRRLRRRRRRRLAVAAPPPSSASSSSPSSSSWSSSSSSQSSS